MGSRPEFIADADAWKREIADEHWKKGQAFELKRAWEDVKQSEFSAAEVEAARRAKAVSKKKQQRRRVPGRVTSELAEPHALARMRGLLGEI